MKWCLAIGHSCFSENEYFRNVDPQLHLWSMLFPTALKAAQASGRGLEKPLSESWCSWTQRRWSNTAAAAHAAVAAAAAAVATFRFQNTGEKLWKCRHRRCDWTVGCAGIHGLFPGDANRGARRQFGTAVRDVWLVVEGAEHMGRSEAGGGRGPQPGGSAQPHTPGPGPAAAGGEAGGGSGRIGAGGGWRRGGDERAAEVR